MKKLYLVRHAKSSWKDISLADFDRPLNKRGQKNAPFMAQKLYNQKLHIDKIISSPALRAKTTAEIIYNRFDLDNDILYLEDIYNFHYDCLEPLIKLLDNKYSDILLLAHNPSINAFVEEYLGIWENIPTNGVVGIEFSCDTWNEINVSNAKKLFFIYPKMYQ